jgi:hypothetical protein
VFSSETDGSIPWKPNWVTKRFIARRRAAGLERFRLHDLRRFMATQMLAGGIPIATVAQRLNHARASTTLNVYAHAVPGGDREAAEFLADLLEADQPSSRHTSWGDYPMAGFFIDIPPAEGRYHETKESLAAEDHRLSRKPRAIQSVGLTRRKPISILSCTMARTLHPSHHGGAHHGAGYSAAEELPSWASLGTRGRSLRRSTRR